MILSATLFLLGVFAYSLKELKSFGKLKWQTESSFWGEDSYYNKYKQDPTNYRKPLTPAPTNWYYRFFKIKYKERFPLSATLLVFLTDGYHLMQFFYKLLFCSAFYPLTNWWFAVILWVLWGILWTVCDRYLTK